VRLTDWHHLDKLSIEKLNAVVFRHNACRNEPVKLVDCEPAPRRRVIRCSG
jgi:hypothetical protein